MRLFWRKRRIIPIGTGPWVWGSVARAGPACRSSFLPPHLMPPQPLYRPGAVTPAFHLRYSWAGWTTSGNLSPNTLQHALALAAPLWEADGLRALEAFPTDDLVQILFSTKVNVAPAFLAARAKGRLQYALRAAGTPCDFSRKVSVRSIGDNTTNNVEHYIAQQVARGNSLDSDWRTFLNQLIVIDPSVVLARPTESRSGRYWYNLHVVLSMANHRSIWDRSTLLGIRNAVLRVARFKDFGLAALSVMPDHLHMALRGMIDTSPESIALTFQNNVAYLLGQRPLWQPGYYVGTFGEYDMDAIRHRVAMCRAAGPASMS